MNHSAIHVMKDKQVERKTKILLHSQSLGFHKFSIYHNGLYMIPSKSDYLPKVPPLHTSHWG